MIASSPSMQLFSHSSAFGPLSELSSRRTFAYLIATLNASHPHYDFSHVLRPGDFKRERNLRRVMGNLDSILQNVRPSSEARNGDVTLTDPSNSIWGPQCWSRIDKEMHLNDCTIFSYHPDIDPFEEDESAIWAVHYFFFNRVLKRVAYLYLRVVPVISSKSPELRPTVPGVKRRRGATLDSSSTNKRAKYWLGDREGEIVAAYDDDDEQNDGLCWNRGEDGDLVPFSDEDYADDYNEYYQEEEEYDSEDNKSPVRGMSEDLVASMEI
jgi:AP-1 complex subunit sigma 1/2